MSTSEDLKCKKAEWIYWQFGRTKLMNLLDRLIDCLIGGKTVHGNRINLH